LFKQAKPYLDKINNIHALEDSLYSTILGVSGTVDCIAEYDGDLAVIDFKTSKKPKPVEWIENYFVQAAAYACMFYEMTDIPVKKLVILMSCENGEVVEYIIDSDEKMKYIKLLVKYIKNFVEHKLSEYGT
jgi:genome maintenance exonuclease 1